MAQIVSAIFLDRDGTINADSGYVHKIDDFHFIDGVIEALQALKRMGFALVMVTNQSGLAWGFFSQEQFMYLMKWMECSLADRGVHLDGIYFCPHHPQAAIERLRQQCTCRKPKAGMLIDAQRHLHIDMASSYMVGDKIDDVLAGQAAGVGVRVLVRSGQLVKKEASKAADWIIDSLSDLLKVIENAKKT